MAVDRCSDKNGEVPTFSYFTEDEYLISEEQYF